MIPIFLLALPLLEIAAFVVVGSAIGVLGTIGLVLASSVLGIVLLRHQARALGVFSIVVGAISLAAFVLYVSGTYFGIGRGIIERVVAYPQTIWYVAMGFAILRRWTPGLLSA